MKKGKNIPNMDPKKDNRLTKKKKILRTFISGIFNVRIILKIRLIICLNKAVGFFSILTFDKSAGKSFNTKFTEHIKVKKERIMHWIEAEVKISWSKLNIFPIIHDDANMTNSGINNVIKIAIML